METKRLFIIVIIFRFPNTMCLQVLFDLLHLLIGRISILRRTAFYDKSGFISIQRLKYCILSFEFHLTVFRVNDTIVTRVSVCFLVALVNLIQMNLSGGEAQRIKLAKALGVSSKGHNLYILDEPTSGLNEVDIERFKNILLSLQENGDTIIIVEHNIEFISKIADYIIDFGTVGGNAGGQVAAQGKPKDVFNCKESSLYNLGI